MRSVSYTLIGLGIIVLIVGVANHVGIHANPIAHTSAIILGVGAVLVVVGAVSMMLGGRSNAAA
jgi:hypothetical protein